MIRIHNQNQLTIEGFESPFERCMDKNNRWVKLSACMPWNDLAEAYYVSFSAQTGRPAKDSRLVIGAVIIKHKLKLSDEETVAQIQENPYLQYFCGLKGFQTEAPFVPSLFVEIRKRLGSDVFEQLHQAIIDKLEKSATTQSKIPTSPDSNATSNPDTDQNLAASTTETTDATVISTLPETAEAIAPAETEQPGQSSDSKPSESESHPKASGRLILDATVAEQAIRYPTDLSLLNESREITESLIDSLYPHSSLKLKPRTYRKVARKAYLAVAKQRRPTRKTLRRGIRQQLQYLQRNLTCINKLLDTLPSPAIPLSPRQLKHYWVIQHLYAQQLAMYQTKTQRCDDRILSIHQPHVRPIVRGKLNKAVEFGAKMSVSLTEQGLANVDQIRWDALVPALLGI